MPFFRVDFCCSLDEVMTIIILKMINYMIVCFFMSHSLVGIHIVVRVGGYKFEYAKARLSSYLRVERGYQ